MKLLRIYLWLWIGFVFVVATVYFVAHAAYSSKVASMLVARVALYEMVAICLAMPAIAIGRWYFRLCRRSYERHYRDVGRLVAEGRDKRWQSSLADDHARDLRMSPTYRDPHSWEPVTPIRMVEPVWARPMDIHDPFRYSRPMDTDDPFRYSRAYSFIPYNVYNHIDHRH